MFLWEGTFIFLMLCDCCSSNHGSIQDPWNQNVTCGKMRGFRIIPCFLYLPENLSSAQWGRRCLLLGVFGCSCPRTVMKGKEEVVTLLCRFEERLQHYLLFIKAIPVSLAGGCHSLLPDNSASTREYFWRLTDNGKLSLLVASSSTYPSSSDRFGSTGHNDWSIA